MMTFERDNCPSEDAFDIVSFRAHDILHWLALPPDEDNEEPGDGEDLDYDFDDDDDEEDDAGWESGDDDDSW